MRRGFKLIAGVDEVGRGSLAGPVVASAVILSADQTVEGLADSKSISSRRREDIFYKIMATSMVGIGAVNEAIIDEINIFRAALKAMEIAIFNLQVKPDWVLIDGPMEPEVPYPMTQIIRGDEICASIAAASIIAKVIRDKMMRVYDKFYPRYGFSQHKGYSTRAHIAKLKGFGPSPIHRYTFGPVRDLSKRTCLLRKEVLG